MTLQTFTLGTFAQQGVAAGSYESIATTTVGATSVSSVSFTSIPQTYTHLQLRGFAKTDSATWVPLSVNNDTQGQRATHYLRGNGTNAAAGAGLGASNEGNYAVLFEASQWGAFVIDILDYTNTNKNKVSRSFYGCDNNGSGAVGISSILHTTNGTTAITSIKLDISQYSGTPKFVQYSHFALYGIKAA